MKSLTFHLILILCIGSIYPFQAIAQRTHNDSLNVEKLRADFDTCVVTARKYWAAGDQRQALKHALNALDIAAKSDSIYDDLMALRMVGQVYGVLQLMDSAEQYLSQAVMIADTVLSLEAIRALSVFANISIYMGKYDRALRYHFINLERAQNIDPEFVHGVYHNIGLVYYKLSDFDRSIQYSEKSLELKTKQKKKAGLEDNLINLALAHLRRGEIEKAEPYLDRVSSICKTEECAPEVLAHASLAMGQLHREKKNATKAISYLLESERQSMKAGHKRYQLDALDNLSQTFIEQGKLNEAKAFLLKGEDILRADASLAQEAANIYTGLARVYALSNQYEAAFKYKELSEKAAEDIQLLQQAAGLMRVEGARIEREYKQRLEDRDRLLALQAGIVSKQRALNIVLGVAAMLAVTLAFVLWRGLIRKKRIARMLDRVVQSRTKEIIERVRLASLAHEETALRTRKAKQELNLAFANIQQLCILAATEDTVAAVKTYLETMSNTAKQAASRMTVLLSSPVANYEDVNDKTLEL